MQVSRTSRRFLRAASILSSMVIGLYALACADPESPPVMPATDVVLSASADSVALVRGTAVSLSIKATRSNGLTGSLTYFVSGVPTGVTATLTQTATPDSSSFSITALSTVAAGLYPIVITVYEGGVEAQQLTIYVRVLPAAASGRTFKTVVSGSGTTCALTGDGIAYCWGSNNSGQLGNATVADVNPVPVLVAGGFTFTDIAISGSGRSVCAVRTGGDAYCWGNNDAGQLGNGTLATQLIPVAVAGGLKFQSVSVGEHHSCGVTHDSAAYCWGLNTYGAIGDGTLGLRVVPMATAGGLAFKSISAANDYTCGLTQAGAAWCWGAGAYGQLGNGSAMNSIIPVPVSGGLTFNALAAGSLDACGRSTDGTAYCWGRNSSGQVGDGTTAQRNAPVIVSGGLHFVQVAAGFQHFCGVTNGGSVYCWGYNAAGALGDGTFTDRSLPTHLVGDPARRFVFETVTIGADHACGVTQITGSTNDIFCWGRNTFGQLGDGTITPSVGPLEVFWP